MNARQTVRLAVARGQIGLGALALRARLNPGMLEGPPLVLDPQPRTAFDGVLEEVRYRAIDYRMDPPKHEFLSYLVHAPGYLLHGTASPQPPR